jgi:hypothetical protein
MMQALGILGIWFILSVVVAIGFGIFARINKREED